MGINKIIFSNDKNFIKILLVLYFIGCLYFAYFFYEFHYLPSPFVSDKKDTFMDFFHSLSSAAIGGRYHQYGSVYPPLVFWFLKGVAFIAQTDIEQSGFVIRERAIILVCGLLFFYFLIPAITLGTKIWKNIPFNEKILCYFLIILSVPMLFALERGNLILLCPFFIALLFSSNHLIRILSLVILINIKPYFLILLVVFIFEKKWDVLIKTTFLTLIFFIISGFLLDHNFYYLFINLFKFGASVPIIHFHEVLSLPSSIESFNYALLRPNQSLPSFLELDIRYREGIALICKVIRWGVITFAFLSLYKFSKNIKNAPNFYPVCILVLIAIITNAGIWVGGYSLILYYPLIPVLLKMHKKYSYLVLLALIATPLDWITFGSQSLGEQFIYLSNTLVRVDWSFSLDTMMRPIANLSLLFLISIEIWPENTKNILNRF